MNEKEVPIAFLGNILHNLNQTEAVELIFAHIEDYKINLQPHYIATANVDFFVHANKDEELLEVLRSASVSTIDGMPVVWACRLLGTQIKGRVTGVDLFYNLLTELEKRKKSIYLLGGNEKTLQLCKLYLSSDYPGLKIAGTSSPMIAYCGEDLQFSSEQDALIVEEINRAAPDILFINLGHPKQELWFDRVKKNLRVPISAGIGGTIDMYTETIPRAPQWMQKSGFEWLFRLKQEPKRLWKRYLSDAIEFPLAVFLPLIYHNMNNLRANFLQLWNSKHDSVCSQLYLSKGYSITFIQLPRMFDKNQAQGLLNAIEDYLNQDAIIFDFKEVLHCSLEGMGFLYQMTQKALKRNKPLFFLDMSFWIRSLWKIHKFKDTLINYQCHSPKDILNRLYGMGWKRCFYDSVRQNHEAIQIGFFGHLDSIFDQQEYLRKITPMMQGKDCIIDLTYCDNLRQSELCLLLNIKKMQATQNRRFQVKGVCKKTKCKLDRFKIDIL